MRRRQKVEIIDTIIEVENVEKVVTYNEDNEEKEMPTDMTLEDPWYEEDKEALKEFVK